MMSAASGEDGAEPSPPKRPRTRSSHLGRSRTLQAEFTVKGTSNFTPWRRPLGRRSRSLPRNGVSVTVWHDRRAPGRRNRRDPLGRLARERCEHGECIKPSVGVRLCAEHAPLERRS